MKRRDFIRAGAFGLTIPASLMNADKLKTNNYPIIISTWNFGLPANDIAMEVLLNGGNAMDAAEAGARHAEADSKNSSVGFGGLPDEDGHVTLDACVMDSRGNAGSVAFLQNIQKTVKITLKKRKFRRKIEKVHKNLFEQKIG